MTMNKNASWLESLTQDLACKVSFFTDKPFYKEEYTIERTFVTVNIQQMEKLIARITEELEHLDNGAKPPAENPDQLRLFE